MGIVVDLNETSLPKALAHGGLGGPFRQLADPQAFLSRLLAHLNVIEPGPRRGRERITLTYRGPLSSTTVCPAQTPYSAIPAKGPQPAQKAL